MFGFFKKPDTRESTDRSLAYLNSLSPEIKATVVEKIEKFLSMVVLGDIQQKDAFTAAMQAKQHCMARLKLHDHQHPEFSMLQLIEDAYLTLNQHAKLASGKYSANKFFDFVIANSTDNQKTMMLLSRSGFDPLFLA